MQLTCTYNVSRFNPTDLFAGNKGPSQFDICNNKIIYFSKDDFVISTTTVNLLGLIFIILLII